MSPLISRRTAFLAAASGGAVLFTGCAAKAQVKAAAPQVPSPPQAFGTLKGDAHVVKPLQFNPAGLRGLSEKLMTSHHDNNYAGAVKNLNKVEEELLRMNKDTPAFIVSGLKQSELTYRNSASLHELYFGNLGGDGRVSGAIEKAVSESSGSFGKWEELFRATGTSLGGGSGWAVLSWDLQRDALTTSWSGNHTQSGVATVPLLVMDMYEHAYQLDYGAAAAKYIDAFFANIHWDEVNRRLEHARKAAALFKG
jgi:superoxide dismutase, Fe-Mn family